MKNTKLALTLILLSSCTLLWGQDFVYKPINPAFGGDTFNYNWLLSSAQEQNQFADDDALNAFGSGLDDFEENFNRQILNLLSRQLVSNAFGDGGIEDGLYTIGSFEIEVSSTAAGLNIYILDTNDGGETTVVVPFY
jgi:curli production assembly/transport component CsgF